MHRYSYSSIGVRRGGTDILKNTYSGQCDDKENCFLFCFGTHYFKLKDDDCVVFFIYIKPPWGHPKWDRDMVSFQVIWFHRSGLIDGAPIGRHIYGNLGNLSTNRKRRITYSTLSSKVFSKF
jgi:hypothetical protein